MNLLLDTHIWIWNHLEPWKVASDVNQALGDPENELWLSPVSIWELATLLEKKRVSLDEDMNTWVEESKRDCFYRKLPFPGTWLTRCGLRCLHIAIRRIDSWLPPQRRET
jgi:PIN domain nuclease of toxin-antitoxin system